jgi:carboxylesterase
VLLLHGFGDTPQTLGYVAPALQQAGFTVHAPLLPGHGRSVEEFARSTGEQWLAAARDAFRSLQREHSHVGIAGLSMGGALAVLLAAETPSLRALVLIAPYVTTPPHVTVLAATQPLWRRLDRVMGSGTTRSIRDPAERARSLGYGRTTGRLLRELWMIGRRARRVLPDVQAPTLIIQSQEDNRIKPRVAQKVLAQLGSAEKRLILTAGAGHIITVDYGRDSVIAEVRRWFEAHLGSDVRSAM